MSKIYEQISANLPGKPFRPSGLYRHAGDFRNGRFVKATRPSPLRPYAQLRTAEGLATEHPVMRWRCSHCLSYLKAKLDDTGQYPRCPQCGHSEERAPEYIPEDDQFTVYAAAPPDTLARVVAYQRARAAGEVPPGPQPVQMIRLGPPPKPFVATLMGSTGDRVIALQRQRGQREPDAYAPLRTMDTTAPCSRCRKSPATCQCVPLPPDVLASCVARAKVRLQLQQQADEAAYPALRKGTI